MAISMLATLNGTIMSGARVPFAMAHDGYFFKSLAEVHPRFRTPSAAIIVQCALAIILLLLGGNFRQFRFGGLAGLQQRGAEGLAPEVLARADLKLSLGPLTLPHGLARIVLAEQLYRAATILAGHPYHRA